MRWLAYWWNKVATFPLQITMDQILLLEGFPPKVSTSQSRYYYSDIWSFAVVVQKCPSVLVSAPAQKDVFAARRTLKHKGSFCQKHSRPDAVFPSNLISNSSPTQSHCLVESLWQLFILLQYLFIWGAHAKLHKWIWAATLWESVLPSHHATSSDKGRSPASSKPLYPPSHLIDSKNILETVNIFMCMCVCLCELTCTPHM